MSDQTIKNPETNHGNSAQRPSCRRSSVGVVMLAALGIFVLLVAYEFRVAVVEFNWFFWFPLIICVGMHVFMHRGHNKGGKIS